MLKLPYIFFNVNIFNFCIRCMWLNMTSIMPNSVGPHCNMIVPLVQHCVIKNGPLDRVSYLYAA